MQVDCLLLGQPKQSKLPPADAGNVPGKVVALQIGSSRFEFFLCAHVRDDVWWCHRGSFLDDTFDAENPFDEKVTLPWYCPSSPIASENDVEWRFVWTPPSAEKLGGAVLHQQELRVSPDIANSYEEICTKLESEICKHDWGLICSCCAAELPDSVCLACQHAVGFHHCQNPNNVPTYGLAEGCATRR